MRQQGQKIGDTWSHFSDAAQRLGVYTSIDYTNIMDSLIKETKSKYIMVSYNNEGIISSEKMMEILKKYGEVEIKRKEYNTFKGSRNLRDRKNKVEEKIYI
jgi:adenine-specific DNA methylase